MAMAASKFVQPRNGKVLPELLDLGSTIDNDLSSRSWYGNTPIGKILFDYVDSNDPDEILITNKGHSLLVLNMAGIELEFMNTFKEWYDPDASVTYNGSNLEEYATALLKNKWQGDSAFIQRSHDIYSNANFKLSQTIINDAEAAITDKYISVFVHEQTDNLPYGFSRSEMISKLTSTISTIDAYLNDNSDTRTIYVSAYEEGGTGYIDEIGKTIIDEWIALFNANSTYKDNVIIKQLIDLEPNATRSEAMTFTDETVYQNYYKRLLKDALIVGKANHVFKTHSMLPTIGQIQSNNQNQTYLI